MSVCNDNAIMTMPVAPAYQNGGGGMGWGGDWASWIILFLIFGMYGYGGFGGYGGYGGQMQSYDTRADLQRGFDNQTVQNKLNGLENGLCDGFYAMNTGMLNGFHGVDNAICQLGYNTQQSFNATQVALMQGQNALQAQLADCCCKTQSGLESVKTQSVMNTNAIQQQLASCCCDIERGQDAIKYQMATDTCALKTAMSDNTRDIIENQNCNTRAVLDFLTQDKIASLQAENQALKFQASQTAQNAFISANQEAQTAELIRRLGRDCPVPAYVVPNPNCCYGTPAGVMNFGGQGGCGCG